MEHRTSFLAFLEVPNPERKTKRWTVLNSSNGADLGLIRFLGAWRKYVFQPHPTSIFDDSCLEEILNFMRAQTKEWRDNL